MTCVVSTLCPVAGPQNIKKWVLGWLGQCCAVAAQISPPATRSWLSPALVSRPLGFLSVMSAFKLIVCWLFCPLGFSFFFFFYYFTSTSHHLSLGLIFQTPAAAPLLPRTLNSLPSCGFIRPAISNLSPPLPPLMQSVFLLRPHDT